MLLLLLIYLVFIGVGLPDSLLGTAWPFMAGEFGANVDSAGLLSMIISAGIILASLTAYRLVRRLGFGLSAACGLSLIALSLTGYALAASFWTALLFSLPLGFGSGLLQTIFNEFVAEHYTARHMSWLHGAWGIGAVAGPLLLAAFSRAGAGWRGGYWAVAAIEAALLVPILCTLPRWKKARQAQAAAAQPCALTSSAQPSGHRLSLWGKICLSGQFFLYCSMENAVMLWGASYLVAAKGMDAALAAQGVSLFFLGITTGRFLCGILAKRVGNMRMIFCSVLTAALLDALLLANGGATVTLVIFPLLGCSMASIYPAMLHQTPALFPRQNLQQLMGMQVASAYLGILIMPPLLGKVFSLLSFRWLPLVQAVCLLGVLLCVTVLKRQAQGLQAGAQTTEKGERNV